ncbi:hypothetical protein OIN60_05980 [Paenibacillus sp. P96]|uniref:PepSY domain-containing protein n=1 Tax=Paenibacillus zeirhizosphaerae TaxID=2987519 RepID=A0ABT9FNL3_9BACL|nr:hypothetical protein [Paenibacillus sp. P96]MDP4096316.1 hypothetical protein [Paenibacillus sp. P96]
MNGKFLVKGKKTAGVAIAAAIMVGSLGTAAYAATGLDTPQKDTLMTAQETNANSKVISGGIKPTVTAEGVVSGPVKDAQALEIAKNRIKEIFGADMDATYAAHTEYYDQKRVEDEKTAYTKGLPDLDTSNYMAWEKQLDRPFWNINFISAEHQQVAGQVIEVDGTFVKKQGQVYSVTIDAENGDVLRISRDLPDAGPSNRLTSAADLEQRAVQFIESHDLNKGKAIKHTEVYDFRMYDNMQAVLELGNGREDYVVFDEESGQVLIYQSRMDQSFLKGLDEEKAALN